MTKLAFMWQSWTKDSNCLVESIGAVLSLGVEPTNCMVWENPKRPVEEFVKLNLLKLGIKFGESSYVRGKSVSDAKERLRVIAETGRITESYYVLRVDSDTVIRTAATLNEAMNRNCFSFSAAWLGWMLSGACCLQRTSVAQIAFDEIDNYRDVLVGSGIGDHIIYYMYDTVCGRHERSWINTKKGFFKAWQYASNEDMQRYAESFEVVTFGNRSMACQQKRNSECDVFEECALAMANFRKFSKEQNNEPFKL